MKLLHFEEVCHFLNKTEEKRLWQFLFSKEKKLKDVRFIFNSCPIGTAIFVTNKSGRQLIDITDYFSW